MNIYKTPNLVNGKVYIGQDSKDRDDYLGSGTYLKRAIAKYGAGNFKKEIMAWCDTKDTKDKLDFLEKFYIRFFNSKVPNGYNITDGGGGKLGWEPTEEERQAIRRRMKRAWRRTKGKLRSPEHGKKIGEALRGRENPKASAALKRRWEEWRQNRFQYAYDNWKFHKVLPHGRVEEVPPDKVKFFPCKN